MLDGGNTNQGEWGVQGDWYFQGSLEGDLGGGQLVDKGDDDIS